MKKYSIILSVLAVSAIGVSASSASAQGVFDSNSWVGNPGHWFQGPMNTGPSTADQKVDWQAPQQYQPSAATLRNYASVPVWIALLDGGVRTNLVVQPGAATTLRFTSGAKLIFNNYPFPLHDNQALSVVNCPGGIALRP
jgi:hypothetical protein